MTISPRSPATPAAAELAHARRTPHVPQARLRYLHRRGRVYYFKHRIPAAVAYAFPEYRGQVWKSLDTEQLETAKVRLAVEVTEFELRVAAARRELACQDVEVWPERRTLRLVLSNADVCAAAEPTTGNSAAQPGNTAAAPARSTTVQRETSGGPHGASPADSQPSANRKRLDRRPTMLHLFEDWKRGQARARSIAAVHATVMDFRTVHGPLAVEELTRAHARAFRDQLIERGLSKSTIVNRLGFLSTLFRHGQAELVDHLALNPFERTPVMTTLAKHRQKERRAYTVAELNLLFSSRLYNGEGYRPDGQARDAAYWLPLMGPFIGARIEELCQLRLEDVQRINGVWCIRICDLGEDQEVKTDSSFRRVPLHEDLIKCGLLV